MKQQIPNSSFEKKLFGLILVFSILVLIFGVFLINKTQSPPSIADKEQIKEILAVKNDDWVRGPNDAPITITEYLDFECEACRVYYPIVKQLKEEYKDKVRFVVRYFPIMGHKNALSSAYAAQAAGNQGKFWEMHDILYENQKNWGGKQFTDPKLFENYVKQIGLDIEKYKKDINSSEVRDRVNRDKNSAISLNIQGTPTFFVNGEKIPNPKGYEDFKNLIDALMPNNLNAY